MADATLPGLLLTGDHASRPAANTVGSGALYSCSDHSLVYQSDASSWTTWATLGGDVSAHTGDTSDAHDASAISVLDTAANFTGTDVEAVLAELQDNIDGVSAGGAPVPWALVPDTGVSNEATAGVGANNRAVIIPAYLVADATITGVQLRVGNQSGNISVGLYDASLARVATSGSVACPASGIAAVSFSGNYSASAGRYYIGLSASASGATFILSSNSSTAGPLHAKFMETAHPLPDPFVSAGATTVSPAMFGLIDGGWAS